MNMRKWNKGFPPHTGWWNASVIKSSSTWRWFDAESQTWSAFASETNSADEAAERAAIKETTASVFIEWTDYWPENARVPRIDPRKTK